MVLSFDGVNWLAVIVCAVIYMILGALWYSPLLFSNTWLRLMGKRQDEIQGNMGAYGITFVAALVLSAALALVVNAFGAATLTDGLLLGGLVWLGFSATATLPFSTFAGPSYSLWTLYNGYQLIFFLIAGAILALWV